MSRVKMHLLSDAVCYPHGECGGRCRWWRGVTERWWAVWRLSATAACPLWLSAIDPFYTQGSMAQISPFGHKPSLSAATASDSLHVFTWGFHNGARKPMWWHINLTCSQSLSLTLARFTQLLCQDIIDWIRILHTSLMFLSKKCCLMLACQHYLCYTVTLFYNEIFWECHFISNSPDFWD